MVNGTFGIPTNLSRLVNPVQLCVTLIARGSLIDGIPATSPYAGARSIKIRGLYAGAKRTRGTLLILFEK